MFWTGEHCHSRSRFLYPFVYPRIQVWSVGQRPSQSENNGVLSLPRLYFSRVVMVTSDCMINERMTTSYFFIPAPKREVGWI